MFRVVRHQQIGVSVEDWDWTWCVTCTTHTHTHMQSIHRAKPADRQSILCCAEPSKQWHKNIPMLLYSPKSNTFRRTVRLTWLNLIHVSSNRSVFVTGLFGLLSSSTTPSLRQSVAIVSINDMVRWGFVGCFVVEVLVVIEPRHFTSAHILKRLGLSCVPVFGGHIYNGQENPL